MPAAPTDGELHKVPCGPLSDKFTVRDVEDDQSTAVPSDAWEGTVSDLSSWDTGNLEELGSCGVLTSAELRAARLQRLARSSTATKKGKAKAAPSSTGSVQTSSELRAMRVSAGQPPKAKAAAAQSARPKCAAMLTTTTSPMQSGSDVDDGSTITPTEGTVSNISLEDSSESVILSSAELRAARLQSTGQTSAKPVVSKQTSSKSMGIANTIQKPKASVPMMKAIENTGVQLKSELDKTSREAIRDMGLWEYMPARNPVVTRTSCKGADWNIGFSEYEHSLGGVPEARPVERSHKADEVMRHLDIQSRETLKEMGLWEHMPAKNPIITRQSCKGADWHIGFEEYQHSLGGVPDSQPIERPHKADDLNRKLDIQSRNAIKEMGMWEHMPAKNPVVTRQSNKGADWHIGFGGYVHTLGGVPDPKIV